MITEEEYKKAIEIVKAYQAQINAEVKKVLPNELPETIEELDLSIRAYKALRFLLATNGYKRNQLRKAVSIITETTLRSVPDCGKKTICEIQDKWSEYGIELT